MRATAGEVLRYGGEIATTFFFSTSGGMTENVENSFYGPPRPYLKGVEDPYDDGSPKHRWRFSFSQRQMQARLAGLVKGRYRAIRVVKRGVSPRIVWADVVGSRGSTRVRGATLRWRLGLNDTWAYFSRLRTVASTRPAGARAAGVGGVDHGWLGRLMPARAVWGEVDPAPRRGAIVVERRDRRGEWRAVRRGRTSASGAYHVAVPSPGLYRVRAAGATGPAVRVR